MEYTNQLLLSVMLALSLPAMSEPIQFTGDSVWEYRIAGGDWSTTAPITVAWPKFWRTYTRWEYDGGTPPHDDAPRMFTNVPSSMVLNGVSACRASLPTYGPGILDMTVGQGAPRKGLWAYVFSALKVGRDQEVVMHIAASGPTQFWIDGLPVVAPLRLTEGEHILAGRVDSGEDDWYVTGCFLPVGMEARRAEPPAVDIVMPAIMGWPANMLASRKSATIALAGDPQSAGAWRRVAHAIAGSGADALVLIGDLVVDGMSADKWNQTFFGPASDALSNIPWLSVTGNHDRRSPLFEQFSSRLNWTREIGEALLVGIDGGLDWSPGSAAAKWLEAVLSTSSSRLVFVVSHYPAYSSRNHGKLAADGEVLERPSRVARKQIVPLLERHHVTAMFTGHDHGYERSELPSGLTHIVTAGAGAGVYPEYEGGRANPYSKVMAAQHHYGMLRIEGGKAYFSAVTPDGTTLDTREWKANQQRERRK